MRIWDLPTNLLCRKHLLGEHRELHALWVVITENKQGYSKHPETKRWFGKLKALYLRHEEQVCEMKNRGYVHNSPLDQSRVQGISVQEVYVNTPEEQKKILRSKNCLCAV